MTVLIYTSMPFFFLIIRLAGNIKDIKNKDQNEINQNMRVASFEVLKSLGELQTIVNYAHFEEDKSRGNPIDGWKHATMVRDLSRLLNPEAAKEGQHLFENWQQNWEKLEEDNHTEAQMSEQIAKTRQAVLSNIDALE